MHRLRRRGRVKVIPPAERDAFRCALGVRRRDVASRARLGAVAGRRRTRVYTLENNRVLVLEARRWLDEVLTTARP